MGADNSANLTPGRRGKRPALPAWRKLDLLADLARGELTLAQLAVKYDRYVTQIHEFAHKSENVEAIARIRSAGMDRLAGLWAADKGNRVAALQASAESLSKDRTPAGQRAHQQALRNIAEELGQLTTKIEGSHRIYQVDGADIADLQ